MKSFRRPTLLVLLAALLHAQEWASLPQPNGDPADLDAWQQQVTAFVKQRPAAAYQVQKLPQGAMEKVLAMPAAAWGKRQWVEFLKERYGYNVERVNAAYGLESPSFSDLLLVDWRKAKRKPDEEGEFLTALRQDLVRVAEPLVGKAKVRLQP